MAQHGTASHYCHKERKGVTSSRGTAWHSFPLLPQRPQRDYRAQETQMAHMAQLTIIRTRSLRRSRALVAHHGTAYHYCRKELHVSEVHKKHKWHSMAQPAIIKTKASRGLRKPRKTRVAQLGTASHYIHGPLDAVKGDNKEH